MGFFKRKVKDGEEKSSTEKDVGTREKLRNLWKSGINEAPQQSEQSVISATSLNPTPQDIVQEDTATSPNESKPDVACSLPESESVSLWDLAYDSLKEEYSEKIEQYERVLSSRDLHGGMSA